MRKRLLFVVTALTAVAVLIGCRGRQQQTEVVEEKVKVKTEVASYVDVQNTVEFTSNIQAFKENNIAPSLPVRIDQILVDVGNRVSLGQLLVRMDPTQYNQANIQLANLEADFQRVKNVYEAGGVSKQELDQLETQLKVQKDQVDNLRTNIELRSPISGVITARNYDPGDMYSMEPILQVMQIEKLKVAVAISEKYFPLVKQGMNADILVDIYPDKVFNGTVSLIYPAIDPLSRTFTVEVTIPNGNHELRPGMFSRTIFHFGSHKGVVVEDIAVQKQVGSNDNFIFVVEDGKAVRRNIIVGRQVGGKIEILSGVRAGDQIIVTGVSRVESGYEVDTEPYSSTFTPKAGTREASIAEQETQEQDE